MTIERIHFDEPPELDLTKDFDSQILAAAKKHAEKSQSLPEGNYDITHGGRRILTSTL